jgi:hypothetical protein
VGALLLLDAARGVGGHTAGAQVYTDGETWIDTLGASLAATAGVRVDAGRSDDPRRSESVSGLLASVNQRARGSRGSSRP